MANKLSTRKRKAPLKRFVSPWSKLPWEKIHLNQEQKKKNHAGGDDEKNFEDMEFYSEKNHYDDPNADTTELYDVNTKLSSSNNGKQTEEYIEGADDPGLFLGLEVIDGSQYSIEKIPIGGTKSSPDGYMTKLVVCEKDGNVDTSKVQENNVDQIIKGNDSTNEVKGNSVTKMEGNDEKNKICTKEIDEAKEIEWSSLSRKEKNKLKLDKFKAKRNEIKLKKRKKKEEKQKLEQHQSESSQEDPVSEGDNSGNIQSGNLVSDKSKKSKKKRAKKSNTNDVASKPISIIPEESIESIRRSWSFATGVYLHENICVSLYKLGFQSPTPIQQSTLAASILGLRDVVGAAPTGSGKTLSYLIPIIQHLLTEEDKRETDQQHNQNNESNQLGKSSHSNSLSALILCPTRELAMQVSSEFAKLTDWSNCQIGSNKSQIETSIKCGTIVGGLSEHKQVRVLNFRRPPVLVGTPGRLWDLMSSGDHEHLNNLHKLRFLVIDEADRMTSKGSFPQLHSILEKVRKTNTSQEHLNGRSNNEEIESEVDYDVDVDDVDDEERMQSLPGVRGEARVQMLSPEMMKLIEKHNGPDKNNFEMDIDHADDKYADQSHKEVENDVSEIAAADDDDDQIIQHNPIEMSDDEYNVQQSKLASELKQLDYSKNDIDEANEAVKRQTFIFSATLTLPSSAHHTISTSQTSRKQKKKHKSVDGVISEILDKVGSQGQVKVVDLSTSSNSQKTQLKSSKIKESEKPRAPKVQLPPGLELYEIRCTQKHKDSHLYSFLATTRQGSSGPSLVFCNSISAVRRVTDTLKVLGLPVKALHAQMQQKARLTALESLRKSQSRSIVVCSDVAARGLDIPTVASVVHYDVARAVDTFVHRSGRTARGMGDNAKGWSVSLVSAAEEKSHKIICQAIKGAGVTSLDVVALDGRQLTNANERVSLASKIVACEDSETNTNKKNKWFVDAAEKAGLDLDEDLLESGLSGGSKRERQRFLEAKQARDKLRILLTKPMRTQSFGKFLSHAGLKNAIKIENDIKPHTINSIPNKRRKTRI